MGKIYLHTSGGMFRVSKSELARGCSRLIGHVETDRVDYALNKLKRLGIHGKSQLEAVEMLGLFGPFVGEVILDQSQADRGEG